MDYCPALWYVCGFPSMGSCVWECESQHSCMHLSASQAPFIGVQLASLWVNIHLYYQSLMGQLTLISDQTRAITVCPPPLLMKWKWLCLLLNILSHSSLTTVVYFNLLEIYTRVRFFYQRPAVYKGEDYPIENFHFHFMLLAYSNQMHNICCWMPADVWMCVCVGVRGGACLAGFCWMNFCEDAFV